MASGTIYGAEESGKRLRLYISWSSTKKTGGSSVSATLYAQNRNGYYYYATVNQGYSLTINGSKKSGSTAKLSSTANGKATLISHSTTVNYTGDKSITISGHANCSNIYPSGGSLGSLSVSGTAKLDKVGTIPSMGSVTAPSTSVISETTSSITVTWNKASSYNGACTYGIGVSINGSSYSWVYPSNNINTTSYTYSVPNKTQGTTYKFVVAAKNDIGWSSYQYSGTVTLNKLNTPTIGSIGTYNPYTSSTLTVSLSGGSQTNGASFKRMCALYYGSTWLWEADYNSVSFGNTSVSITYAAASYTSLIGTTAYSSGNFRILSWIENSNRTRSGYVERYFTVNLNTDGGATPTLAAPTLSGGAFGYPSTCFISGVTNLVVTSGAGATRRAPSGTTLSYTISVSGASSQNGSSATFSGLSIGAKTIAVTVRDSRGLTTTQTKTCIVQSYAPPTIKNIKGERLASPNTSGKVTYTLSYSPIYANGSSGTNLNGISVQQMSKQGASYVDYTSGTAITSLNTELTYKIDIRVADKVKTTNYITQLAIIPTIKVGFAFRRGGLGINGVPSNGVALNVVGTVAHNDKKVFTGNDGWLRINEPNDFTSGVYFGNSVVRTDGQFQVGQNGSGASISSGGVFTGNHFMAKGGFLSKETGSTYANYWQRIAYVNLTQRYQDCDGTIDFDITDHGNGSTGHGTIYFRVKQQEAMGSKPNGMLEIDGSGYGYGGANSFVLKLTQNTTTQTSVELWFKIPITYCAYSFYPRTNSGKGKYVMSGSDFVNTSGTVWITGKKANGEFNVIKPDYINAAWGNEITFATDRSELWFNYRKGEGFSTAPSRFYFGNGNGGLGIVKAASFEGKATSAANADYATNATNANWATNAGGANSASNLSNKYLKTNGTEWFGLYNSSGNRKGWIGHNGESYLSIVCEGGSIAFNFDGVGTAMNYNSSYKTFRPLAGNTGQISLGSGGSRWNTLYSVASPNVSSDYNLKKNIDVLNDKYYKLAQLIDIVKYQLKQTDQEDGIGRTHIGVISQQVEKAINDVGLTPKDFAGFCKDQKYHIEVDKKGKESDPIQIDGEYIYSMRYEELAMLKIWYLEQRLNKLENKLNIGG